MNIDKGLQSDTSTVVSFAFSCSTKSGSRSGSELWAVLFSSSSDNFQMLAGQWLAANCQHLFWQFAALRYMLTLGYMLLNDSGGETVRGTKSEKTGKPEVWQLR